MNIDYWVNVSETYHWSIVGWGVLFLIVASMFEHRGRLNRIKNLKKALEVKRYRRKRNKIA